MDLDSDLDSDMDSDSDLDSDVDSDSDLDLDSDLDSDLDFVSKEMRIEEEEEEDDTKNPLVEDARKVGDAVQAAVEQLGEPLGAAPEKVVD